MAFPNKATQFPINRQDHTQKGPYLIPLLKKFLEKKISFEDPETQKMIRGKVKDAIVWRLLLNAAQGENEAIKEVFNRVDGKLTEILFDQSKHTHYQFEYKQLDENTIRASQSSNGSLEQPGKVEGSGSGQEIRKDNLGGTRIDEEGSEPPKS